MSATTTRSKRTVISSVEAGDIPRAPEVDKTEKVVTFWSETYRGLTLYLPKLGYNVEFRESTRKHPWDNTDVRWGRLEISDEAAIAEIREMNDAGMIPGRKLIEGA